MYKTKLGRYKGDTWFIRYYTIK